MKIYIIEDDLSVIGILEDIIERRALGTVCGSTEGGPVKPEQVLSADPDLILIDLLMPGKDGIQVIRELREQGFRGKCVMISQVTSKDLIAKAYLAGVDFFIQKPINLIEVSQVIGNVARQLKSEQALASIRSVFEEERPAPAPAASWEAIRRRRLRYLLGQLGMSGEKGGQDITEMCLKLLELGQPASQVGVSALCGLLSASPRSMEQRARRAAERGLRHVASLGLEDYNNEIFTRCATQLFSFQEVRAEMSFLQGKGQGGRVNLKKFLDGVLLLTEED